MKDRRHLDLSRRERQIMDILFRKGKATAGEVHSEMPERPSYSAVRAHLRSLEEKGHVRHQTEELRYVYLPTVRPDRARRTALRHLVHTFFGGSHARAVAALLDEESAKLTPAELDRLAAWIERAKQGEV